MEHRYKHYKMHACLEKYDKENKMFKFLGFINTKPIKVNKQKGKNEFGEEYWYVPKHIDKSIRVKLTKEIQAKYELFKKQDTKNKLRMFGNIITRTWGDY